MNEVLSNLFQEIRTGLSKFIGWICLVSFAVLYYSILHESFVTPGVYQTILGLGNPEPLFLFVTIGFVGTAVQFSFCCATKKSQVGKWIRSFAFDGLQLIFSVFIVFSVANAFRGHMELIVDTLPIFLVLSASLILFESLIEVAAISINFFPLRLLMAFSALFIAHAFA